jgi:hypothetical protein
MLYFATGKAIPSMAQHPDSFSRYIHLIQRLTAVRVIECEAFLPAFPDMVNSVLL